jgi:hypothetical protein
MRCDFNRLCAYVHNELSEDRKCETIAHLHECDICLEAVCLMCAELDTQFETEEFVTSTNGSRNRFHEAGR